MQLGASVLAHPGFGDFAAQVAGHELRAVTDAEQRNARVVDRRIDLGRAVDVHRRRAARQDDRGRLLGEHLRDGHRAGDDLAVHVGFTNPARDQLRVLRPEVDDEDDVGGVTHAGSARHADALRALQRLAFGLQRGGDHHFGLLKFFDGFVAGCCHGGAQRPEQVERAVVFVGGTDENLR